MQYLGQAHQAPVEIDPDFPATLLANKFLYPSRLSCENDFGKVKGVNFFHEALWYFLRIPLLCLGFVMSSPLKLQKRKKDRAEGEKIDCLIVSHFVGPKPDYNQDPFLGQVASTARRTFKTKTFFLNGTKYSSRSAEKFIRESLKDDFVVAKGKKSPISVLSAFSNVLDEFINLERKTLSREILPHRRYLQRMLFRHTTFSTLSILLTWSEISYLISTHRPSFLLMPSEGNVHELYYLHKIKSKFPKVKVTLYQHAPLVVSQPGFYLTISNLRTTDALLLSSQTSKEFIANAVAGKPLKCEVRVIGNTRSQLIAGIRVKKRPTKLTSGRKVLVAPEGTKCAVIELMRVIETWLATDQNDEIRIRLHPDYVPNRNTRKYFLERGLSWLISKNSLSEDLLWADELWFRISSVVDPAIRQHVLPVHINLCADVDLNPLKFSKQPKIEIRSMQDLGSLQLSRARVSHLRFSRSEKDFIFMKFRQSALFRQPD